MVRWFFTLFFCALPLYAAAEQSFSDVPPGSEIFDAVENLQKRGVVQGRPNGTFSPGEFVNRAEAVTIIVRAVANVKNLPAINDCFSDVQGDHWYVQPVCYAKDLAWVSGYEGGTFQPIRNVSKGEFLKILFTAYGVDTGPSSQFRESLAADASHPDTWYYPYFAYAITRGMTSADGYGNLNPAYALTRGQVALLIHRFLIAREEDITQSLLINVERDIRFLFAAIDALAPEQADFAAHRAHLAAWAARERRADSLLVASTLKITEGLGKLTTAYILVKDLAFKQAILHAQEAYHMADQADAIDLQTKVYTDKLRSYAHSLAEAIRGYKQ